MRAMCLETNAFCASLMLLPFQGEWMECHYPGRCPGLSACWAFSPHYGKHSSSNKCRSSKSQCGSRNKILEKWCVGNSDIPLLLRVLIVVVRNFRTTTKQDMRMKQD